MEVGALCGAIRPEDIEAVMQLSQPVQTQVVREDTGDGNDGKDEAGARSGHREKMAAGAG
jgi:hypothetical protein